MGGKCTETPNLKIEASAMPLQFRNPVSDFVRLNVFPASKKKKNSNRLAFHGGLPWSTEAGLGMEWEGTEP